MSDKKKHLEGNMPGETPDGKIHPRQKPGWWQHGIATFATIRFRLMLWYVATTAILLLISSALLYMTLAQTLQQSEAAVDAQLSSITKKIASSYYPYPAKSGFKPEMNGLVNGTIIVYTSPDGKIEYSYIMEEEGKLVRLTNDNGKKIQFALRNIGQSCSVVQRFSLAQTSGKGDALREPSLASGAPYITCQTALISPQGRHVGTIIVGQPHDDAGILQRLLFNLALVIPTILFILAVGGYWVASRAMRPVHTITQTARQIDKTDLSKRIRLNSRDELGELAATFDSMLSRLETLFEHQRRFTADASHELRTPLTVMNVAINQALEGRVQPTNYEEALSLLEKDERALLTAREENEHMTRLVNDLLLLARADTGQQLLDKEEVDMSEVTLDVVERLVPLAQARHVELSLGELPELLVEGDRNYLTSMLINLIENAVKYTSGHGTYVHIASECSMHEQREWCRIAIEDDGPGIEPELVSHIFERFYRIVMARPEQTEGLDSTKTLEAPRGSGLGLAIVHWIAQAHGGKICLESTIGKGSCFEVWLPLARTAHESPITQD